MTENRQREERPTDGLDFTPFKLKHLGGGDIGGDLEAEIDRMAIELADVDTFGADAKARITLTIDMVRDKRTVAISTTIKTTPPTPMPKSTVAWATGKGLMVQPTEQLTIDSVRRSGRAEKDE